MQARNTTEGLKKGVEGTEMDNAGESKGKNEKGL